MRWGDVISSTSSEDCCNFLEWWFETGDTVVLTGMTEIGVSRVQSVRAPVDDLVESIRKSPNILEKMSEGRDMYFSVASAGENGVAGGRLREADIAHVRGIYCDLDVKSGAFNSKDDAENFLKEVSESLGYSCGIVESGSGGLHAYWKFEDSPEIDDVVASKKLLGAWWAYLNEVSTSKYGASIDRLVDLARMLRLPGSIRLDTGASVKLVQTGDSVPPGEMVKLSQGAFERRSEYVSKVRIREKTSQTSVEVSSVRVAACSAWVTEHIEWGDILRGAGWTKLWGEGVGSTWARPGQNKKSAVIWGEGAGILSLFSSSIDTGMADLKEAGIVLDKWRVLLRLYFADDVGSATEWVSSRLG